jgi:hypothetical protein
MSTPGSPPTSPRRIQDLRRVKGIGQKTLAKLAPHLAVDGDSDLTAE